MMSRAGTFYSIWDTDVPALPVSDAPRPVSPRFLPKMGLSFAKLWDRFFGKQEMRILMVGLDAAGP